MTAKSLPKALFAAAALILAASSQASPVPGDVLLTENFDNVAGLNGWVQINNSVQPGQDWNQGFAVQSGAQSGASDSYINATYNSAAGGTGSIDLWLLTPEITMGAATLLSFYTAGGGNGFPDLMEVRFGAGGGTALSGFTDLLATIGGAGGYPGDWQNITAQVGANTSGRFAFRYLVNDANNADAVAIDTLSVTAVPEPGSFALIGLGLAGACVARRKLRRAV
jgi:hypothetical protein